MIKLISLSLLGLFVSIFLAYQYSLPQPVLCFTGENINSCENVRNSEYSKIFGIQLPFLGILYFFSLSFYLSIPLITKLSLKLANLHFNLLGLPLFGAFVFESVMSYIQIFIIKSLCFWCSLIEIIVFFMLVFYFLEVRGKKMPLSSNNS